LPTAIVIPNEGKLLLLYWSLVTDGSDLEDFVLDLYQNDYTPVDGSTGTDFTVATFSSYSQVAVSRASFSSPAIVANVAYTTSGATTEFICAGATSNTCYGWYLRGATSGTVIAAQRFNNARLMNDGAIETITFKIGGGTLV